MINKVEPGRDSHGFWVHPQLLEFWNQYEEEWIPIEDWKSWTNSHGITTMSVSMEDTIDWESHLYTYYFEYGGNDCSEWDPLEHFDADWDLLAIYDTEDGPVAIVYREADNESS